MLGISHTSLVRVGNFFRSPNRVRCIIISPSSIHVDSCDSYTNRESSKLRRMSSSKNENDPNSSDLHQSYKEQMYELERERDHLFGSNSVGNHDPHTTSSADDININREELFNFSSEEKDTWSSFDTNSSFSSEFMNTIKQSREETLLHGESKKGEIEFPQHSFDFPSAVTTSSRNEHFTHLNEKGDEVSMVDVGGKKVTRRVAIARSSVYFPPEVMEAFGIQNSYDNEGTKSERSISLPKEIVGAKGPIFSTARLAGIIGAKRTSDLIPLCHPLPLDRVQIDITLHGNRAIIECECCVTHKTGVEMEALTGASIAALTIYDMVKAVSHRVQIESTKLIKKSGGNRDVE